jgi:hypothetical protein
MASNIYERRETYPHGPFETRVFTWFELPVVLVTVALAGFFLGCILLVIPAVAQILALGWSSAWHIYHPIWLRFAIMTAVAMTGAFVMAVAFDRLYVAVYGMHRASKFFRRLKLAVVTIIILGVVGGVGWVAFISARRNQSVRASVIASAFRNERSTPPAPNAPAVTADAQRLLTELDAKMTHDSRSALEVRQILGSLSQTNAHPEDMARRLAQLRVASENARAISRQDLVQAQRSGWWQGILLGVLTSVVGSFVFSWLTSFASRH